MRASAAIPFLFEPVRVNSQFGKLTLADGSLLRSYPIEVFDRTDGKPSRWPTLGVRLSSPAGERAKATPVTSPASLLTNLIKTTVDSTQVRHVSDPAVDRPQHLRQAARRALDRLRPHARAAHEPVRGRSPGRDPLGREAPRRPGAVRPLRGMKFGASLS